VNIAARLQAIAEPGGICLSERAQEDATGRVKVVFEDIGEQSLKNIERPVRAYRVNLDGKPGTAAPPSRRSRQPVLPDKPSVAVLPFQNMSGDAEQDYFADGVVEDIITALSRFRSFAVIARNSSFVYKGRSVDVRQVAGELGVRYVLEGSVRRSGERVRLTAQFVDADSGAHLWARNFDGKLADIFDFQDRITESVVAVVEPQIQRAEIERSRRERPGSIAAYDLYLAAMEKFHAARDRENTEAYALLTKAVELEPNNGLMLAQTAQLIQHRIVMGWPPFSSNDRSIAHDLVHRALANARGDAPVLASAGLTLIANREYDLGFSAMKAAVDANPNHFDVVVWAGVGNLHCGSLEDARTYFERALRLSPADPHAFVALTGIADVLLIQGDDKGALDYAERATGLNMSYDPAYWMMIAANVRLGRMDDAKRWLAKFKALSPGVTISSIRAGQPMKDPARLAPILDGLRAAGLEEG
jgi:TolB-like protein/Tfp pilus assembly protein PilF